MRVRNLSIFVLIVFSAATALAGGEALWSYEGPAGPQRWGELSPGWAICGDGTYQSPIDIRKPIPAPLGAVQAEIRPTPLRFGLDGPTFAVPYEGDSMLTVDGIRYELQQFHFHHPSEHTLDGKSFPMEAHLVLRSEGGARNDAVLGVLITPGRENAMLAQFWDRLPRSARKSLKGVRVNVGDLLPQDTRYYLYEGSMTTPSCPQSVRWFVLETPVEASQAQIDTFIADFTQGSSNNRPVQPRHGRVVLKGN